MAFSITDHSLRADRGRTSLLFLMTGLALLGAWIIWAFTGRVTRYEVSDSARLEVAGAASPIEADLSGEVRVSHLSLGRPVTAGQILLELDNRDQQWHWWQEKIRHDELVPQLAALEAQVESEDTGQMDEQKVLVYSRKGAEAQVRQAEIEAGQAVSEAKRTEQLHAEGLISEADLEKSRSTARSKQAELDLMKQAAQRLTPELKVRATDRDARKRQILTEIAKLRADIAESDAEINHLRYEMERRRISAAVSGTVTECVILHAGAHIAVGQQLGVILPPGKMRVVAEFDPASAFGKIHSGQHANVRMNGFPWAQFGVLSASVSHVAGEIRDGKVRVELAILKTNQSRIPLQHGLPGLVEVEVEQVTPAGLLLRSAGQTVDAP